MDPEIRRALENHEFVYHYQPKVDLLMGQVCGVEALLRWVKPDGSIIPPNDFIPEAEASGFMHELSIAMFDKLLADFAIIHQLSPHLIFSFNLTAQDFYTDSFLNKMSFAVLSSQIDPAHFQIELTETTLINSSAIVKEHIQAVVDMGVSLAMDDFGTGYSTIDVLSQWPFSVVKIDQGLIGRMQTDEKSITIVRNSIHMAHQLGLKVLAEGVESEEVYDFLLKSGCSEVQGFLMARPMPLEQLLSFLQVDQRWAGSPIGLIHMAQADHLQWRRQLIDYTLARLYGTPHLAIWKDSQVQPERHCCLLGKWYYGPGSAYKGKASYDALETPHLFLHELSASILVAVENGIPHGEVISLLRTMTEKSCEVISLLQQLELEALLDRSEASTIGCQGDIFQ